MRRTRRSRLFDRRSVAAGASPGTLAPVEDAPPSRVSVLRYDKAAIDEEPSRPLDDRPIDIPPGKVTWIDVQGLGATEAIRALGQRAGLHRLTVADIVNTGQRPKFEDYGDYLYLVVKMATLDEGGAIHWEQVSIVCMEGAVLTFQERYGDCLDGVRKRLRGGAPVIRGSGADYLASQVADAIVDGYFPVLEAYGERLEDLETRVVSAPGRDVLDAAYAIRRELVRFRRAAWPLRDALIQILRDRHALLQPSTLPYLRDTADHVTQVVDVLENYRELAGSLVDVYLSIMSHRTNEVMRVLTVIATIFIPLTFLAGVYGMNFDTSSPYNMPELGFRYGYVVFWVVSILSGLSLLYLFRRLGWLGGGEDDVA